MKSMNRNLVALAVGLAATGIALAGGKTLFVNEGEVGQYWTATSAPNVAPYPTQIADRSRDVCVSIGYQIDKQGKQGEYAVLRSWSSDKPDEDAPVDDAFVQIAAGLISQWKFAPSPQGPAKRALYTSSSIVFVGDKKSDPAAVRRRCRIDDLDDYVARLQEKENRRGNLTKERMDRSQRENNLNERAVQQQNTRNGGGQ